MGFSEEVMAFEKILLGCRYNSRSFLDLCNPRHSICLWWCVNYDFFLFLGSPESKKATTWVSRHQLHLLNLFLYLVFLAISVPIMKIVAFLVQPLRRRNENPPPRRILCTSENIEWRNTGQAGDPEKNDAFFSPVFTKIRELAGPGTVEFYGTYDVRRPFITSIRIWREKIFSKGFYFYPLPVFGSFSDIFTFLQIRKDLRGNWKEFSSSPTFSAIIRRYDPVSADIITSRLDTYFSHMFPVFYINYIQSMRMIEKIKPDIILIEEEYGGFERSLIQAAKDTGVKTLAVQHGMMSDRENAYILPSVSDNLNPCPISDITSVYGRYERDLLIEKSIYHDENIVITGSHRYDDLVNNRYSREEFCRRHGIPETHTLILWTSQANILPMEENELNYSILFSSLSHLDRCTLLVKPHPGEGQQYHALYARYQEKYPISSVFSPSGAGIYELLSVCDILITKHSITGLEAMLLKKHVLVLNLGAHGDVGDYVSAGAAAGVYAPDMLLPALKGMISGETDLREKMDEYVRYHLFEQDGKATGRIADLVLKESGKKITSPISGV